VLLKNSTVLHKSCCSNKKWTQLCVMCHTTIKLLWFCFLDILVNKIISETPFIWYNVLCLRIWYFPIYFYYSHLLPKNDGKILIFEGARNNMPDPDACIAAQEIIRLCENATDENLVIVLISGGIYWTMFLRWCVDGCVCGAMNLCGDSVKYVCNLWLKE